MSEMIGTYRDAGLVDGVKAKLQLIATTSGWRGSAVIESSALSDELWQEFYMDPPTTAEITIGDRTATATEVITRELPDGGWRLDFVGAGKPPFEVEAPAG